MSEPQPMTSLPPDPLPIVRGHVRLRRLRAGDLPAFHAYRCDAELARYQGWSAMSAGEAGRFIAEMAVEPLFRPGEWIQLAIADAASDRLLGDIGLSLAADGASAEVGFTLARAAQGRGIATAAGEAVVALVYAHTAAAAIVGITDERNAASIALLMRLGMRQVESRQTVFKGEACTELVFSRER